jgi:hypothetical protein
VFHKRKRCYHCQVAVGQRHHPGCWFEQCPYCGWARNSCSCPGFPPERKRLPWTGLFLGAAECREFGWFLSAGRWGTGERCGSDEPNAMEDLNRLHEEARWDPVTKRFVLREAPASPEPASVPDVGCAGRPSKAA